jgi:putative phosphoesterase
MRLGILSDTHDQLTRTARAVSKLESLGAETLIHCGDLTTPDIVYVCASRPCYFVRGNNDFDEVGIRAAIETIGSGVWLGMGGEITLAGRRIAVTHGDSPSIFRRLLQAAPDYLLFGHTHVPMDSGDAGTRQINPGALHRASTWTVALLDLETGALEFVPIR